MGEGDDIEPVLKEEPESKGWRYGDLFQTICSWVVYLPLVLVPLVLFGIDTGLKTFAPERLAAVEAQRKTSAPQCVVNVMRLEKQPNGSEKEVLAERREVPCVSATKSSDTVSGWIIGWCVLGFIVVSGAAGAFMLLLGFGRW